MKLVLGVLLALGLPAVVEAEEAHPQPRCVQALSVPFVFVHMSGASASHPCRFVATAPGGFSAAGVDWLVRVDRPDGPVTFWGGSGHGCRDDVIEPGDEVLIRAQGVAGAGAGFGC